jgi:lysophospholipase L1-like esterase
VFFVILSSRRGKWFGPRERNEPRGHEEIQLTNNTNHLKRYIGFLICFALIAFLPLRKERLTIYLIGDSTMADKSIRAYPETGWGMPFKYFFDSSVTLENHAKNGRSTKSFREEKLWDPIVSKLQPGDYVFIQFGHNDESPEKVGRYTTPEQFKNNLLQYVEETRKKKANPLLLTPVARRSFDSGGRPVNTHGIYGELVKEVAAAAKVPLIDVQQSSGSLLQAFGEEGSKLLFLHLEPGEHPNYPQGKVDNTHFSELGARKIAQLVLKEIRNLKLPLAQNIINASGSR